MKNFASFTTSIRNVEVRPVIECPDCGTGLREERNQLTESEYTTVLDCPTCDFGLESMSNLAAKEMECGQA